MRVLFSISFFILSYALNVAAQSGFIAFNVVPYNTKITIDSVRFATKAAYELDTGTYVVQFEAPDYEVHRREVQVKEGETLHVTLSLRRSEAWKLYKKEMDLYRASKLSIQVAVPLAYGLYLGNSVYQLYRMDQDLVQAYSNALEQKQAYEESIDQNEIMEARLEYERLKSDYENDLQLFKNRRYREIAFNVGGAIITAGALYFASTLKPPTYNSGLEVSLFQGRAQETNVFGLMLNIPLHER